MLWLRSFCAIRRIYNWNATFADESLERLCLELNCSGHVSYYAMTMMGYSAHVLTLSKKYNEAKRGKLFTGDYTEKKKQVC